MPLCPVGGRARGLPVPRSPLEAVYLVGMYMGKGGGISHAGVAVLRGSEGRGFPPGWLHACSRSAAPCLGLPR